MQRMRSPLLRNAAGLVGLLITIFLVASCAVSPTVLPRSEQDLQAAYRAAILDASIAEPHEISTGLTPIVHWNTHLIWDRSSGEEYVLMVTWTNWNGYDEQIGRRVVLTREVWVTAAPQLRDFCRNLKPRSDDGLLRMEQVLGLPPAGGKNRLVEMWVRPDDLFRPSPDPEVTDMESGLDFPASNRFVAVSPEHRKWIEDLKANSYGPKGYPWTRLGYTYDWGNPQSEIGLSEFVVRPGAEVVIRAVLPNQAYLQ